MTMTTRKAALALIGAAGLYMVAALATGRSARAEVPVDLSPPPADLGLDVWRAVAALVEADGQALVLDVRPVDAYWRYHLPGAESAPGASAADIAERAGGRPLVLVYAGKDEVARELVQAARKAAPRARIHYLVDGARGFYLALALPVPLFAEAEPPAGYATAAERVQAWLARPDAARRASTQEAVQTLARLAYQPTLLQTRAKPAAGAGGKKKISGGCG